MKMIWKGLIGLGAVTATALVGLATWDNLSAEASTPDPMVTHDMRIERDKFGVPHIFGKTDADVAYGLAIAHAEDDFANLEEVVAAVRGRAGAISGEEGAKIDFARALIAPKRDADKGYAALSPGTRAIMEAYARGLNHYAARHPAEQRLRGLFPINGRDIVAGFILRSPFFYGFDRPLGALVEGKLPPRDSGPTDERGSNAFAVTAGRSDDATTRLIVNSHQPWEGGVSWWEVVVHSEEGWDFAGALFPGAPYPLLGHNKHLGWGNTVNRPDLVDTYKLVMDDSGTRYRFDGKWLPLETGRVWLRVKFGPLVLPIPRTLYRSVHGPVIRNDLGTFALRYAGIGDARQVEQYYRLNKARNFTEFQSAMAMQAVSGTNFVYADAEGHVAMIYNARFPARTPGYDWKAVLPGDTAKTLWTSYVPYTAYPQVIDPAAGWVGNANNTPFLSTAPADELDPAAFAPEMGLETYVTNRALRYQTLFAAIKAPISRAALLRIKFDAGYDKASWAGRWVAKIMAVDTSANPAQAEAQKLLATWDWSLDGKGSADTLATALLGKGARAGYGGLPLPDAAPMLAEAVAELTETFGRIDPPMGDYQRLRRGAVDLPVFGGPDALRAIYSKREADGRKAGFNGDGFMMVIEWPRGAPVASQSIHQFGAATIRSSSPHYNDQSALFAAEKWKETGFWSKGIAK